MSDHIGWTVQSREAKSARRTVIVLATALGLAGCVAGGPVRSQGPATVQPVLESRHKPVLTVDGLHFRDLDGDGRLSAYEDWRLSAETRAEDLTGRMTLGEKVGTLMHSTLPGAGGMLGRGEGYDLLAVAALVDGKHVTSFITRLKLAPAALAGQNNAVQEVAERGRLGIPVTISTDPRNHFQHILGASESGAGTTQWPEPLGFAALRDPRIVREFGEVARREYRAVGIHMALSPQLDLVTEPRWSRNIATFGSNADLASLLGAAYVQGFQGAEKGLAPDGVIAVVKHWVGYGAQPDGYDAHNHYGRFARPGAHIDLHMRAFEGALAAGSGGVMPAYPILQDAMVDGAPIEQVGPGFSRRLLTGLLREKLGFKGIIVSDWGITSDCNQRCAAPTAETPQRPQDIATSWGVEHLTVRERYVRGIDAGLDQFGGTDDVAPLIEAVEKGDIDPARIDASVRRILIPKFTLGLFENPYVDPAQALAATGTAEDVALADKVQREAQILLKARDPALPFPEGGKVWLFGMAPDAARAAGLIVVGDPAQADFAIIRTGAPSERLHPHHFFGSRQREGRLDFRDGDEAYEALKNASAHAPVALAIFLDRPAILTNVQDKAQVVLANFGASDAAVLDVLLGRAVARGRLPFELPRSMQAVEAQDPGAPDDTVDPLYPFGSGIVP